MGISKKKKFVVDFDGVLSRLNKTIGELINLYEEKDEEDSDKEPIMEWIKMLCKLESWLVELYDYENEKDGLFDYNYIVKEINTILSECGIRDTILTNDYETVLVNCDTAWVKATNYLICYGIM